MEMANKKNSKIRSGWRMDGRQNDYNGKRVPWGRERAWDERWRLSDTPLAKAGLSEEAANRDETREEQ
jgi:hypothetical protein